MATKQSKPETTNLQSASPSTLTPYNWKDHPLATAAVTAAATLGLCVLFFTEVVIPTQTAHLTNQLADLPAFQKRIADAEEKTALLEKQLTETRSRLVEALHSNLFVFGNPYPTGLGQVKVGDPIGKVLEIYTQHQIDRDEDGIYTVNLKESPFKRVSYEFDADSPAKKIYMITFESFGENPDYKASQEALKNKLTEVLGTPTMSARKRFNVYAWRVSPVLGVQLGSIGNGYSLHSLP